MNDLPGLLRRLGTYAGLLGAVLLFFGALFVKGTTGVVSYIGILLGVISYLLGLYFSLRKRSFGWIGLMLVVAAIGVVGGVVAVSVAGSLDLIDIFIP